jgi:hypothetical protein
LSIVQHTPDEARSSQAFADKMTRMDVRLAMRAGMRYTTQAHPALEPGREWAVPEQHRQNETPLREPGSVLEPLALKTQATAPDEMMEDESWLNDVIPARHRPTLPVPIPGEQLADDQTLTCWL